MNQKRAKWIIGGMLVIVLTAVIALIVTKLSGRSNQPSEKEPTKVVLPEVPEGSVPVWRLATETSTEKSSDFSGRCTVKYTYDELGRCTEQLTSYDDGKTERLQYAYDEENHTRRETTYADDGIETVLYDEYGRTVKESTVLYDENHNEYTSRAVDILYYAGPDDRREGSYHESEYNPDGTKTYSLRGAYNRNTGVSLYEWYNGATDEWEPSFEINYDEQGRPLSKYAYVSMVEDDGRVSKRLVREYEYAENGFRTEKAYSYGELRSVTEYDADNRQLRFTSFESDGTIKLTIVSSFRENIYGGQTQRYQTYEKGITLISESTVEYDSNNVLRKKTVYDRETHPEPTVIYLAEVDSDGRIIHETRSSYYITDLEYDDFGNCVKTHMYRTDKDYSVTTEYTYVPFVLTEEQLRLSESYYTPKDVTGRKVLP